MHINIFLSKAKLRFSSFLLCLSLFILFQPVSAQKEIYRMRWAADVPIATIGIGTTTASFILKKNKKSLSEDQINNLHITDINRFDRGATKQWSPKIAKLSDVAMLGGMAMPGLLYIDKDIRKDFRSVLPMTLEMYFLTFGLTGLTKELVKRNRPYVYNTDVPFDEKVSKDATSSFFSGHTSMTAASCFFTAKVFADYHPDSKWKPLVWTGASLIPALTGLMRYKAGKHYWTDILTGYAVGAITGILVPTIHKKIAEKK